MKEYEVSYRVLNIVTHLLGFYENNAKNSVTAEIFKTGYDAVTELHSANWALQYAMDNENAAKMAIVVHQKALDLSVFSVAAVTDDQRNALRMSADKLDSMLKTTMGKADDAFKSAMLVASHMPDPASAQGLLANLLEPLRNSMHEYQLQQPDIWDEISGFKDPDAAVGIMWDSSVKVDEIHFPESSDSRSGGSPEETHGPNEVNELTPLLTAIGLQGGGSQLLQPDLV